MMGKSFIIILLSLTSLAVADKPQEETSKSCRTRKCLEDRGYVDFSVDKCIKPYGNACGKHMDDEIPDIASKWDFEFKRYTDFINNFPDMVKVKNPKIKAFETHEKFAEACFNIGKRNERGVKPFVDTMKNIGGSDLLTPGYFKPDLYTNPLELYIKMVSLGLPANMFFSVGVGYDRNDMPYKRLYIGQHNEYKDEVYIALSSLRKEEDDRIVTGYKEYMKNISMNFNPDLSEDRVDEIVDEFMVFMRKMAKIMKTPAEKTELAKQYIKMSLKNLTQELNLKQPYTFTKFMQEYVSAVGSDLVITDDTKIVVSDPTYLKDVLHFLSEQKPKDIANYVSLISAAENIRFLDQKTDDVVSDYFFESYKIARVDAPFRCAIIMDNMHFFNLVEGMKFIEFTFPEGVDANKKKAQEIIDEIKEVIGSILEDHERLKKKFESITYVIGYPKQLDNATLLNSLLDGLKVDLDKFFEDHLAYNIFSRKKNLDSVETKVPPTDYTQLTRVRELRLNYFYNRKTNVLFLKAGWLMPPILDEDNDSEQNFGTLGLVVAEQMLHSVSYEGRLYSEDGKLDDLWSDVIKKRYNETRKCFKEQLKGIKDKRFPNKRGIEEDVHKSLFPQSLAQLVAYKAWRNYEKKKCKVDASDERPLDALSRSALFFYHELEILCSKLTDGLMLQRLGRNNAILPETFTAEILANNFLQNIWQPESCKGKPGPDSCDVWSVFTGKPFMKDE